MTVQIVSEAFDPWATLSDYTSKHAGTLGSYGATGIFVGTMRDFNEGCRIDTMELEHYPGMTEKALERIVEDAQARWAIVDALIVHRVGTVRPGDPIVLTASWSRHRGDALDACRHIMEALKSRAPFWKRESVAGRTRWVEQNTDGYDHS